MIMMTMTTILMTIMRSSALLSCWMGSHQDDYDNDGDSDDDIDDDTTINLDQTTAHINAVLLDEESSK